MPWKTAPVAAPSRRSIDWTARAGAAVTAFFAVLLVIGAVSATDADDAGEAAGFDGDPVQDLIRAFEDSRTATYRAEGTITRTEPGGRSLSSETVFVQRPPDRLLREYGDGSGRRDDRELTCGFGDGLDPGFECALGPAGAPFDAVVDAEVADFARLVLGDDPLYEVVRRTEDCWRLTRTRFDPRSGFGVETELCFDPESGAVASRRTDHGEIVEELVHTTFALEVDDADLEP